MVWAIDTFTGINKYTRKYRRSVQTHQKKLDTIAWSAHDRTDFSCWSRSGR